MNKPLLVGSAVILGTLMTASSVRAERFIALIDPSRSTITVTLNLAGGSATDSSPASGSVELILDTVRTPTTVTGLDYSILLTETLMLDVSFGLFGNFESDLQNFRLFYSAPGTPVGPVPLNMGQYTFPTTEARTEGTLTYTATGTVCAFLTNNMLPCNDIDDLSTEPPTPVDFSGTVSVAPNRVVTLTTNVDFTRPVDSMNPALGTVRTVGTLVASVFVPVIRGDADGDCAVSFADITTVLLNFGQTSVIGDADNSGAVNFVDITVILTSWGNLCP